MGTSMYPTLRRADLLVLEAEPDLPIRRGDVIVFSQPDEAQPIVHRVEAVTQEGFITRGDYCATADPWVVRPERIRGRVQHIVREKCALPVPRALFCVGRARIRTMLLGPARKARAFLQPAYQHLSRSWMPRKLLFPLLKPSLLCLRRPEGLEWKLFTGNQEIGFLPPGETSWRIRRPYLLLVDESSLPAGLAGEHASLTKLSRNMKCSSLPDSMPGC